MKVFTLDGIEYNLAVPTKVSRGNRRQSSNLHTLARKILKVKYVNLSIYEEMPISVYSNKLLYLDFYVPQLLTAIEVNGAQHYSFTPRYHVNNMAFLHMQKNDRAKSEWCELNKIKLIVLPFDKVKQWESYL